MKRAAIIFIILFIATLLIPLTSVIEHNKETKNEELVTIFSSQMIMNDSNAIQ